MNTPDYAEPIVGWRLWHVAERGGALRLRSPLYRTPWLPRTELVAVCRRGLEAGLSLYPPKRSRHPSPDPVCRCGVYGSRTVTDAAAYLTKLFKSPDDVLHRVIGTVSLWGTVVECDRGWRASHAYPRQIYVPVPSKRSRLFTVGGLRRPALPPAEIADALAEYGVTVELVECSSLGELAETLTQRSWLPAERAAA